MRPIFYLILLLSPFPLSAQGTSPQKMRGEVFKAYADNPSEDLREAKVAVYRSLYRLRFEDPDIPEKYKKAIKEFFKRHYNGFTRTGKYEIEVAKKWGEIHIEGKRIDPEGL